MRRSIETNRAIKIELERVLGAYLLSRRWYGEKSKTISHLNWTRLGQVRLDHLELHMGVVDVGLASGVTVTYSLPIVVGSVSRSIEPIVILESSGGDLFVYDAIEHGSFQSWLITVLQGRASEELQSLGTSWLPTTALLEPVKLGSISNSRVSGAEQSNSSVFLGEKIIVKFFRKIRSGLNPDVEVGRFLTSVAHFDSVPTTYGEIRVSIQSGKDASLAIAQAYVESVADGWEYSRAKLASMAELESFERGSLDSWLAEAQQLGETTADLHHALAGNFGNVDFAPEPVNTDDVATWTDDLHANLRSVLDRLNRPEISERVDPSLASAIVHASSRLTETAKNLSLLINCSKTRVHGDYHLGQTLRTVDGRWVILDFEGEPARTIEERRAKSSPLRDVAGMLRSFNYARGITARQIGQENSASLVKWEKQTREAFLNGYFDKARPGSARFMPKTQEDARLALNAWELHKALYEVLYELDNRPSWAWLPIAAILKLA
jgi:maltose alpha-D-glucosyltransferase / alpha-amylase